MITVGLIVSVRQKAESNAVPRDHGSPVRRLSACGGPHCPDSMLFQPVHRVLDAVPAAVPRMVVSRGHDTNAGLQQALNHLRLGLEQHALFDHPAAVGERRFEVRKGNVRRRQQYRYVAQRPARIAFRSGDNADIA
jgi:hypothetical protein